MVALRSACHLSGYNTKPRQDRFVRREDRLAHASCSFSGCKQDLRRMAPESREWSHKAQPKIFGHFQLSVLALPSVSRDAGLVSRMAREQRNEPWVDWMARERYLPQTNIAGRFFLKLVVGKHPCDSDQCKRLLVGGQSGFGLSASFLQTREHPNQAGKLLLSTESFSVKGSASPLLHMKGLHP